MFIIQIFLLFYVLFISFILSSWDKRIQRYNGRGKTGLGKWGNGRRYLGRDEMGIQRYNGRGKMGLGKWGNGSMHFQLFCRHLLLFSSSAFGIAGMREEAAGLQ
jgi:hypothetical protein